MDFPTLSAINLADWRGSITTFNGFTGTRPEQELNDVSWSGVTNLICPDTPAIIADKKQGQYFVPCKLKDAPLVGNTLEAAKNTGLPTTGKMRSKSHVTESQILVVDVDGLSEADFNAGLTKMLGDGITFVAYTTHSHGREDKPGMRARLVIPLDREITIEEYDLAWHGADHKYWGGKAGQADASGANLYQQQGTWACDPSRAKLARKWQHNHGVISADALISIGKAMQPPLTKSLTPTSTLTVDQVPHAPVSVAFSNTVVNDPPDLHRLASALKVLDPDCDVSTWMFHRMAPLAYLAREFPELADTYRTLAIRWSSGDLRGVPSTKWSKPGNNGLSGAQYFVRVWKRFLTDNYQGRRATVATIFHHAKEVGWVYTPGQSESADFEGVSKL